MTDREPSRISESLQQSIGSRETIAPSGIDSTPTGSGPFASLPIAFGRFEVQKLLGKGAMGTVYLAVDPELNRPDLDNQVALKIPKFQTNDDPTLLERFWREAQATGAMDHPNICKLYEVGEINGTHYISMEYVDGRPLSDYIEPGQFQEQRQVAGIIRKLAQGFGHAHERGFLHRDLKPSNVMIATDGQPKIMDFGLARRIGVTGDIKLTQSNTIVGSPAYMSPEQARSENDTLTPTSDIYSLGTLFFELLTSELPFKGPMAIVLGMIALNRVPKPSTIRPDVDPRLEALCLKMQEKKAAARPQSMLEVADTLTEWLRPAATKSNPTVTLVEEPVALAPKKTAAPHVSQTDPIEAQKQRVTELLDKRQYGPAMELLEKMTNLRDTKFEKLVAWAKPKLKEVRATEQKLKEASAPMCALAQQDLKRHDYTSAVQNLEQVPPAYRSIELRDLLQQATDLRDECDHLQRDIEEAIRTGDADTLPALIKRLLKLRPNSKAIKQLAADLKQYGAKKVIAQRKGQRLAVTNERLFESQQIAAYVLGIAALFATVYFAVVAYVQTPHGTLVVDVQGEGLQAIVQDGHVIIRDGKQEFRVKSTDKKTLTVEHRGSIITGSSREITLKRGEKRTVTIKLVDGKVQLTENAETFVFPVPETHVVPPGGNGGGQKGGTPPNNVAPSFANAPFSTDEAKKHQVAWAKYLNMNVESSVKMESDVVGGLKMVVIPPGLFRMGLRDGLLPNETHCHPQHEVTITNPFLMATTEVTQELFERVMGRNPSAFTTQGSRKQIVGNRDTKRQSVETVSWYDAIEFCNKLSLMEGHSLAYVLSDFRYDDSGKMTSATVRWNRDADGYRLPTDAEWELACRAGTTTDYWFGDTLPNDIAPFARTGKGEKVTSADMGPDVAGKRQPNPFGLLDMYGNVCEYCFDVFDPGWYSKSLTTNPVCEFGDLRRVIRGGSWGWWMYASSSGMRGGLDPAFTGEGEGIRVVRSIRMPPPTALNPPVANDGWVSLFNGKDLNGWSLYPSDAKAEGHWGVKDGVLNGNGRAVRSYWDGVLVSDREYRHFELRCDVRLHTPTDRPHSDGGIGIRTAPLISGPPSYVEVALESKKDAMPVWRTGALGGAVAPSKDVYRENEWNSLVVRDDGESVTITLNDVEVVSHRMSDLNAKANPPGGKILLQAADGDVEFRNIRIKELVAASTSLIDGARSITSALSLNGVNDHVRIPHQPHLDLTREATLSAWVKFVTRPSQAGHTMTIFAKSGNRSDLDLQAEINNRFKFFGGDGWSIEGTTTIEAGRWYHVAATYKANDRVALYINGVAEAINSNPPVRSSNSNPLMIGQSAIWPGRFLNGQITDVRLWNVARTGQHIHDDMALRLTGREPNLVGYWPLDEVSGAVAKDKTSAGVHGAVLGNAATNTNAWFKLAVSEISPPQTKESSEQKTSQKLTAPKHISPTDGSIFQPNVFPRTTELRWSTVPQAARYQVQVQFGTPDKGNWTGHDKADGVEVNGTTFKFDFVGSQPGRWRVRALNSSGHEGAWSDWWEFSYGGLVESTTSGTALNLGKITDPQRRFAHWVILSGGAVAPKNGQWTNQLSKLPPGTFTVDGADLVDLKSIPEPIEAIAPQLRLSWIVSKNNPREAAIALAGKNASTLKALKFEGPVTDAQLAQLRESNILESIEFYAAYGYTEQGLKNLKKFPNLTKAIFNAGWIDDASLAHLSELKHINELMLWATSVTDEGLVHLQSMTSLEKLRLESSQLIRGPGLRHLTKLPKLTSLSLYGTSFSDAGMEFVGKLSSIEALGVSLTKITDDQLHHLDNLRKLRSLSIGTTQVTEAGLAKLNILGRLTDLELNNTGLTNAGLASLRRNKNLKRLLVLKTKVTEDAVISFRKALPNCVIESDFPASKRK